MARRLRLALFFLVPPGTGLLGLALGQDANWDLRNYHWYNAHALLSGRLGYDLLPAQLPSFYNPALDVPYYLLASLGSAQLAGFVLATVQGLNFILLYLLAQTTLRIVDPLIKTVCCALLGLLGLMGGGTIAQIGTTFYDNIISIGVLLSLYLVLRLSARMVEESLGRVFLLAFLCGLPAGLMTGLKLPAVIFAAGLCGGLLFFPAPPLRRIWLALTFGCGVLLGLAIAYGPWALYLSREYGSPLFPYFNNLFQSPLAPATSSRDVQFIPSGFLDALFFPARFAANPYLVGEIFWRDLRLPLLYFLLPLCLAAHYLLSKGIAPARHLAGDPKTRYLLASATLTYLVWLQLFSIYRYAITMEMLAPLLLVLCLGLLPLRPRLTAALTIGLLALITLTIRPGTWGRTPAWLDSPVSIEHPELDNPRELMILMAGFEPYSHVISGFPREIPFVRIQSNFASPGEDKGINRLIRERVLQHQGSYKLLIPEYQLHFGLDALKHFNLAIARPSCQPVTDQLYDNQLVLCDVQRACAIAATP